MTAADEKRLVGRITIIVLVVSMLGGCLGTVAGETLDLAKWVFGVNREDSQSSSQKAKEQGALEQRVATNERVVQSLVAQAKSDHDMIVEMHSWMRDMKQRDAQGARQ